MVCGVVGVERTPVTETGANVSKIWWMDSV